MKTTENAEKKNNFETKYVVKLIVASAFGLFSFMVPLPIFQNKTLVAFFSDYLLTNFDYFLSFFVWAVTVISATFSIVAEFIPDEKSLESKSLNYIKDNFRTSNLYLMTKIIAAVIVTIIMLGIELPILTSDETGLQMLSLSKSLVTISIALSYVLPFLTSCGAMEFFGVLLKDFIEPLFKVPAIASIDLVASWFGAANAEVLLAREKYQKGYYSKRDTANIMANFSLVSISFIYIVCQAGDIEEYFPIVFIIASAISIVLAIIMPRIKPLKSIPASYYNDSPNIVEDTVPAGYNKFTWGLNLGVERAKTFGIKQIIPDGTRIMLSIWKDLVPIVIGWGTVGLILVYYTPVFTILSYPIGLVLDLLGIAEAYVAAPATLVGFIDMFIPALLITNIQSIQTRFIIVVLSLIQMIYITEVGAIMLQSDIGIDMKRLVIIFIERTLLAFPIIYIISLIMF